VNASRGRPLLMPANLFARITLAPMIFWICVAALFASASEPVQLRGNILDENGAPVSGMEVFIRPPDESIQTLHTDMSGAFNYSGTKAGEYLISLNKTGFFRINNRALALKEGLNEICFTVNHETEIHEEVEVYSYTESVEPLVTTNSSTLIAREIRDIPVPSTHDLRSSLQIMPDVVRDNSGQLHIAGGRTGETQYLLDGFDIGDPVTGELSVRVNVDSIRAAEVESGRYSARYGSAGAGVLALDTAVGDDHWRAGATNFMPGINFQQGVHLANWYPRFTLSGPLKKERAWFSEALSILHTLTIVEGLPPDEDSISRWAGDNMLRIQLKPAPNNMLQGNFLYNQQNASNLGLSPFSPISTTRQERTYRSFFSIKEQIWSGRTFYELGIAADHSHSESLPHGFGPYIVTPNGSAGYYFEALQQKSRRWQAVGTVSMPPRRWHGTHDFEFGFAASELRWDHKAGRSSIEVVRADNTVAQRVDFAGPPQFNLSDFQAGVYAHDSWRVLKPLVLQLGIREDWDRILHCSTASPRIAANFLPFDNSNTKLTAAWGVFLQPLMFSSFGPAYDQRRFDVFYDNTGKIPILGPVISTFALPTDHLKQPRFHTLSLGWEQIVGKKTQIKTNFIHRSERLGLAYEKTAGNPDENFLILQNNRRDHYRSFQVSLRHSFNDKTGISGSYTRSSARTNQVFDYSLDTLVFTPQQPGPLDWDAPNRVVSTGWAPTPIWDLFLSYFFEYRTGFPFSVVNAQQQVVGLPNRLRFPDYASFNMGVEKRIHLFAREWAVRLTILNITNHSNPDAVINNIDSPDFLEFAGGQSRSITARVRLIS
jgi:hypothetical protein